MTPIRRTLALAVGLASLSLPASAEPLSISGIYPSLSMFNDEGECGTGAVVPWADRLWVITYAPHKPKGSTDKLYEINDALEQTVRPESVGGTPANRMIHRESNQLFIGPYAIDAQRQVRVITPKAMPGRHTGNARHLTDPAGKIYYATMEEGLYEVDVKTLAATTIFKDGHDTPQLAGPLLPGYHGKGLYSSQGRVVYANNGEHSPLARERPDIDSGVLAEWSGKDWQVVRRNQFTEVTGPGGIQGNAKPETDPLWSIGWDHRSLILMLLDGGKWTSYRLPKASHSYDGAHGWNTEWPRIREIGEKDFLMTMHGMFWKFPSTFTAANSAGIRPRSAYLKVIGDFARWKDRLVFGCDDSAKSEFLNKRKVKGEIAGPGQSQSNLWFTAPDVVDKLGPVQASGALWLRDKVSKGDVSDPFLLAGWEQRSAHFINGGKEPMSFTLEADTAGNGQWKEIAQIAAAPGEAVWRDLSQEKAEWVRVKAGADCATATVHFTYTSGDKRQAEMDPMFAGLAEIGDGSALGGLVRARGGNLRTLHLAAQRGTAEQTDLGNYELDANLQFKPLTELNAEDDLKRIVAIPRNAVTVDESSVLVVDGRKRRWRLPKTDAAYDEPTRAGQLRISREVATERDLFNLHGTFYELPAENADGFAKIRPVSTHRLQIADYCSYRGLLIMTGLKPDAKAGKHILRTADGQAGLWAGTIDDLWRLGKPRGQGGPWHETAVKAGESSDPYLAWAYDRRRLALSHSAKEAVSIRVEADLTGDGLWVTHKSFEVPAGKAVEYEFPAAFQARWVRFTADRDCSATAKLTYE